MPRYSHRRALKAVCFLSLVLCIHFLTHSPENLTQVVNGVVDGLVEEALLSTFSKNDLKISGKRQFLRLVQGHSGLAAAESTPRLCRTLQGKKVLFVGPDTTYHLHSVWLELLEAMEGRSHTCFGRDYCTFHHICQQPALENAESNIGSSEIRKKKMPGRRILVDTNSSLLLYSASTSLFASPNKWNPKYSHVDVNPRYGVRESNSYWLKHAPKVDVMVLSMAPIPAPSWTYDSSSAGNWTYTRRLCKDHNYIGSKCDLDLENRIVNAAFHATVGQFLPRLLTTLVYLSRNSASDKPTLLWHGSWYIPPVCSRNAMPKSATLVPDKWSDHDGRESVDPWTLYYNAQVYIHHGILTRVLPYFNTTYIPLAYSSVRSGKTEIRQAPPNIQFSPSGKRKDCIRDVDFSTGSVPSVFLDKLLTAMARATEDEHFSMY